MSNIRAGLVSGLIAVIVTSAVNIICRLIGLFPDALDLKYMAELLINPTTYPTPAFWIGLVLHILGGTLIGLIFVLLIKRPTPLKGIIFSLIVVWLPMLLVIFPLRGRGFLGLNVGLIMPIATFVLNIVYGLTAGAFAQRLVVNVDAEFAETIGNALSEAYKRAKAAEQRDGAYSFDIATQKMIIFSDLHKGARDRADDFQVAEQAYNAALGYYFEMGHTLVGLGDVEELWEERIDPVIKSYDYTLKLEGQFHQAGRYLRFWGNHDDDWKNPDTVEKYLQDQYKGDKLVVRESILIRLTNWGAPLGTLFMVHGHQGTVDSDQLAFLSKPLVRLLWKPFQNLTGISLNTPSKNWQLRDLHNEAMYQWAAYQNELAKSPQEKLIFVVGHTHRPVFQSYLHAVKIREEVDNKTQQLMADPNNAALREELALCSAELEWVLSQERQRPGNEGLKLKPPLEPCHFNTGCCCFYDGDITGIEIAHGQISLVRWPNDTGAPAPKILEHALLTDVFAALNTPAQTGSNEG